ncbi:MAG TPA: SRPBCC family protein [Herpetosiphonaceae bacterium]|nr:SRPBCC family protein [Herpetosiphonaceae bacterium]
MHVDSQAPAYVSGEKLVNAPAQVVWEVVSRIEEWPTWNPDVQKATLDGALAAGTAFRWQAGRAKITSRLEEVTAPTVIGWSGKLPGIAARHVWRIEPRGDQTLVSTQESWHGIVPRIFRARSRKMLQAAVDSGLQAIKDEVERRMAVGRNQ